MRKYKGFMSILLMFVLCFSLQAATTNKSELEKKYNASLGVIVSYSDVEKTNVICAGSGFYIGNGLYVTVGTYTLDAKKIEYYPLSGESPLELAGVVKYDEEQDFALLKGKEIPQFKALPIGDNKNIKLGANVRLLGTDPDGNLECIDTTVNKYTKADGRVNILVKAQIPDSLAGGPMLDAKGNVIAMNYVSYEGINLCMGIDAIKASCSYLLKQPFEKIYCMATPTTQS